MTSRSGVGVALWEQRREGGSDGRRGWAAKADEGCYSWSAYGAVGGRCCQRKKKGSRMHHSEAEREPMRQQHRRRLARRSASEPHPRRGVPSLYAFSFFFSPLFTSSFGRDEQLTLLVRLGTRGRAGNAQARSLSGGRYEAITGVRQRFETAEVLVITRRQEACKKKAAGRAAAAVEA